MSDDDNMADDRRRGSSRKADKDKGRAKGRGFQRTFEGDQERYLGKAGQFESLEDTENTDAQPCN